MSRASMKVKGVRNEIEETFFQPRLQPSPRAAGAEKLPTGFECCSDAFRRGHARRRKTDADTHRGPDGNPDTDTHSGRDDDPDASRAHGKDCVLLQRHLRHERGWDQPDDRLHFWGRSFMVARRHTDCIWYQSRHLEDECRWHG